MNPAASAAKKKNMKRILQYIVDHEGVTRINIAQQLDLSVATVTNNINDLIGLKLVTAGDKISGNLGRKATILKFEGEGKYIVIVSMHIQSLLITTVDFNGTVVKQMEEFSIPTGRNAQGEVIRQTFTDIITGYVDGLEGDVRQKIACMAIAVTGIVSRDKKVYASYYQWYNIPILDELERRYEFPIYCDNITRYKARQEIRMIGQDMMNVIYLYVGIGVGCVQFFGGKIVEGINGAGGEIGHVCLDPYAQICHCGNRGCVERLCGENYVLEDAEKFLEGQDGCKILKYLVNDMKMPLTIETLIKAEELGSAKVHGLFMRTALYIGKTLAFLYNVMDPDCVILAGELLELSDFVYEMAVQEMKTAIVNADARVIHIERAKTRQADLVGAMCHYAVEYYIKNLDFTLPVTGEKNGE